MRHKRLLSLFPVIAAVFGFMFPQATMAQDAPLDEFGFSPSTASAAIVTQEEDGSWTINTQGTDPFVTTTPLSRDLTADENTLTFEYKASEDANIEIFVSKAAGEYEAGRSFVLGVAPATKEWTRVNVDITQMRADFAWGSAGQTLRMDAGTEGGLKFQIRDFRVSADKLDPTAGFETKEGVIQLNTQADFDKWVAEMNAFVSGDLLSNVDVDLNTNVTATSAEGCVVINYRGVFNGNFNTITLDLNTKHESLEAGTAFIQELYGTVQNVYFDGTVEGQSKYLTTVAQDLNTGALLKNVHSAVNIVSHVDGDGTHGGIAGRCEGAVTLKNVVFAGSMSSPEGTTDCCGGLVGWVNVKSTFDGCLMIADMSGILDNGCNTIGRNQGQIDGKNIFALAAKTETPASCTIVTPEQMESGEICFKLNGDQREIAWYQNIGEDPLPTFDSTHKQVYAVGDFRCDGTPLSEGVTYNNESGSTIPEHSYTNGVCDICGLTQPGFLTEQDGWFVITTPEQLAFIANYASSNPSTKIKIDADLDMSGIDYKPITGVFAGTIDGQHHTISNLIVVNPEADMQALVGLAGACTIKNLTLDNTCYFEGKGYCAGFVGETSGSVTITMEGLFMHGNVKGSAANIAAIYACNMNTTATIKMTNCGMSGLIDGGNESGLISGWFGEGYATLNGVWAIGDVIGADNATTSVFCRPGTGNAFTNCWSIKGDRSEIGKLGEDAGSTGELTWKLNGSSFENPTWFQNLEEGDAYPSLKSERGIVYPVVDGYATVFPDDPESFAAFKKGFADVAAAYLENEDVTTYGSTILVAEYAELAAVYADCNTMDEFIVAWKAEQAKKKEVDASITAYKNYEALIGEIFAELDSRDDFSGDDRDFLENEYIDGGLEPGVDERAPNGSSDYILENRLLNASEVNKEIEHAKELLRIAVANGYEPGTEITNMLVNYNFADGRNGWKGTVFNGSGMDSREGSTMSAAEIWSATPHDMYQEIVAAKGGVYELQVRGGYRPFDEQMSIQYYPYIYINGNANYLQAIIEDYIPVEDAIDGETCNLDPNQVPDRPITNEEGDTIGWAIHGVQSCCVAFSNGRYDNRILINANEGDTLRIGIKHPYSEFGGNEWVGIGDIHLTYHGEMDASEEAVDRVLASMLARANVLLGIQHTTDETYVKYPNYSQALKEQVIASIEKAAGAADVATKYEVIEELSAAFVEIVACKKAYKHFFATVEDVYSYAFAAGEIDPNCGEMGVQAQAIQAEAMAAYEGGTMTTEEALECAIAKTINVYPTTDENGAYHVANTAQYAAFVDMVNGGKNDVNLILDSDVMMNTSMVMSTFYGDIDGQDHTITVDIEPTADNGAMISSLYSSHVQNLIIRGTITTPYKYAAGVAAHTYDGCTFDRIQSYVDIVGTIAGDATHGGIVAVNETGTAYVNNSVFAGSMSGTGNSNGGIVGWSSATSVATGCLVIANITADQTNGNIIGRNSTQANNCYYVTAYGSAPTGATQIEEAALLDGSVTYGLNGGSTRKDVVWRQNLTGDAADAVPSLDPTHGIVYIKADGTFTNEIQNEIEKYNGTQEDPYILNTATDMALLRSFLMPGRVNYVKLGADIDMAEITEWYPLNMEEDQANGLGYQNIIDFDGQGHVISNFSCTTEDGSYNSFFGILNGEVRNVGFKDANVVCTKSGTGILAGYMGHDQYKNADYTKKASSLTNVWVTGKLNVAEGYAGGMIGNVGGPTNIKNCYTNIEITSEANYIGGIVGRVRDELNIDQAYAAGSIITTASENVGGIIGGGQLVATAPGYYNNVVVWNNTDENFGATIAATEKTLPTADVLDVVFNEDGTATDKSPMQNEITAMGEPKVQYSDKYGCNVFFSEANGTTPISWYMINYAQNDAMKAALTDGYTMETTFALHDDAITGTIKPFCATQSGGFGIEMSTDGQIKHIAYTTIEGAGAYRYGNSTAYASKGHYFHVVGVYDKSGKKIAVYVNGINRAEGTADGELTFPTDEIAQWIGIGADPSGTENVGQSAANFEIINARIYNEPVSEDMAKALYYKQMKNKSFYAGDYKNNISYSNGSNFTDLQGIVVAWGSPWQCDMTDGTYPTFDGSTADGINGVTIDTKGKIFNINGIQVEKTTKGLYIIDGKKVMVK